MSFCIICRRDLEVFRTLLCTICWSEIEFIDLEERYEHNGIVQYNDIVRRLIHIFKYKSPWILCDLFVNWISLLCDDLMKEIDIVIPVPIHRQKLMKRGYNQAAVIARKLAHKYQKKCLLEALLKIRHTKSQSTLSGDERRKNVIDSFKVNQNKAHLITGKNILLIDDVVTTGSTMIECKKVLSIANPKQIKTLSIAITKYE